LAKLTEFMVSVLRIRRVRLSLGHPDPVNNKQKE
jgi:hypothetical protein